MAEEDRGGDRDVIGSVVRKVSEIFRKGRGERRRLGGPGIRMTTDLE